VTALGKLFRTTTFKLTLVYLTVFALFAAFLLGYFALNTRRLITEQITDTVNAEITGLSEQYRLGEGWSSSWMPGLDDRAPVSIW
jgi:predicted PurR-regulated permease PerM